MSKTYAAYVETGGWMYLVSGLTAATTIERMLIDIKRHHPEGEFFDLRNYFLTSNDGQFEPEAEEALYVTLKENLTITEEIA